MNDVNASPTFRLFDEIEYLKRRAQFAETELRHVRERIVIVEQSLFASLTEIDGLPVIVAHIIYQCAIEYGVTVQELRSGTENRKADLQAGRNLAVYRIRELGQYGWEKVAGWFCITRAKAETCYKHGKNIHTSKVAKP